MKQAGGALHTTKQSLKESILLLRSRFGPQPQAWKFGRIHQVYMPHAMSIIFGPKPFSIGPFEVRGSPTTVCMGSQQLDNRDFAPTSVDGPSYRHVIDLADLNHSFNVMPCGQSGILGHPYYNNQLPRYLAMEYFPMYFDRKEIEAKAKHRLAIVPDPHFSFPPATRSCIIS